jgi:hypothetical protein
VLRSRIFCLCLLGFLGAAYNLDWCKFVAAHRGERRCAYRGLVGKPEGRRPRRRWDDNIKMDVREVGCGGMNWISLAQDRDRCRALVNTVINRNVKLDHQLSLIYKTSGRPTCKASSLFGSSNLITTWF